MLNYTSNYSVEAVAYISYVLYSYGKIPFIASRSVIIFGGASGIEQGFARNFCAIPEAEHVILVEYYVSFETALNSLTRSLGRSSAATDESIRDVN